jgi:hypothetical protein
MHTLPLLTLFEPNEVYMKLQCTTFKCETSPEHFSLNMTTLSGTDQFEFPYVQCVINLEHFQQLT